MFNTPFTHTPSFLSFFLSFFSFLFFSFFFWGGGGGGGGGGGEKVLGIPRVFDVLDDFLAFHWEKVEMTNTLTLISKYT